VECRLLSFKTELLGGIQTFRRIIYPLSSGPKIKPSKKPVQTVGKMTDIYPEDGGIIIPQEVALPTE
jgi:hypothetical protein